MEEQKKNKGGAPTEYRPEYVEIMNNLFDIDNIQVEKDKTGRVVHVKFPTLAEAAIRIGHEQGTLIDWSEKVDKDGNYVFPEFRQAWHRAKQVQDYLIQEHGLNGNFNGPFAMFFAKNNLGYKDKTESEVEHKGGISLTDLYKASKDESS